MTAIIASGRQLLLLRKVENRPGVLSVTHHHARHRQPAHSPGADVLVGKGRADGAGRCAAGDEIFALLFAAGKISEPHQGIIHEAVRRGHPDDALPELISRCFRRFRLNSRCTVGRGRRAR